MRVDNKCESSNFNKIIWKLIINCLMKRWFATSYLHDFLRRGIRTGQQHVMLRHDALSDKVLEHQPAETRVRVLFCKEFALSKKTAEEIDSGRHIKTRTPHMEHRRVLKTATTKQRDVLMVRTTRNFCVMQVTSKELSSSGGGCLDKQ